MNESLNEFQKRLLTILQNPFPICRRPFQRLGEILRSDESTVLKETIALKSAGWIRRFRGQINYRALGRTAVLVTACVPEDRLNEVGQAINCLPDVSHNYVRRHRFNLWFTLQGSSESDIDRKLDDLSRCTGVTFHSLPAFRLFKLDVRFPLVDSEESITETPECLDVQFPTTAVQLSSLQQVVLTSVQRELSLIIQPFDSLADRDPEQTIQTLQSLQSLGVLRRISAVMDYRRLGFIANTMFGAVLPENKIIPAGLDLAGCPLVSHCYHRRPIPEWGYNLFAMFHARTTAEVTNAAKSFAGRWKVADYALLDTIAELKKQPVIY
jgi:DNA-binding Lrp family transcriptional regulator